MTDNTPDITVYGAYWCPDCRRSKQFLGEFQIPYKWVDIEKDKDSEIYELEKNAGKRIIPTIEFGICWMKINSSQIMDYGLSQKNMKGSLSNSMLMTWISLLATNQESHKALCSVETPTGAVPSGFH